MNPVLIAAGVYLSARIISFIAGELTETEQKNQREIDAEIERIRTTYHRNEAASEVTLDGNESEEADGQEIMGAVKANIMGP